MFQDIAPHSYHNEFQITEPASSDYLIVLNGRSLLLKTEAAARVPAAEEPGEYGLPTVGEIREISPEAASSAFYLFSIDEKRFFLTLTPVSADASAPVSGGTPEAGPGKDSVSGGQASPRFTYVNQMALREMEEDYLAFGAAVACQLGSWYSLHQYCGKCGVRTVRSRIERAIICPECGHIYYPRISPVVIIAIVDPASDRILLTMYNKRKKPRRHSLVAGFVEIGETLEDAVRREIMEEVGLKVKNIRYCESQPWPFSSSLIAGFFADVDGDSAVHLNTDGKDELAEAIWVHRDEIEVEDHAVSLTWDMIRRFARHEEPV